jgi:hypothetical protein
MEALGNGQGTQHGICNGINDHEHGGLHHL